MLDTPSDSLTSLYVDAVAARRAPLFSHIAFLGLWAVLVAVDGVERLPDSRFMVGLIAALLQLVAAAIALVLCAVAFVRDVRVDYLFNRALPLHLPIVLYVVCAHAVVAALAPRPRAIVILAAIATAAPRTQLLLAPVYFIATGLRLSALSRALIALITPLVSGMCALACAFTTIAQRRDGGLLVQPAVIGRLPLLSFLAALVLTFWAIAGFLAIWSNDENTIRIHIVASAPVLLFVVANFSAVQPALDNIAGKSKRAAFGDVSPTTLVVLLSVAIALTPLLLAIHLEELRVRRAQMVPFSILETLQSTRFPLGKDPDAVKAFGRLELIESLRTDSMDEDASSAINLSWSEWVRRQPITSVSCT